MIHLILISCWDINLDCFWLMRSVYLLMLWMNFLFTDDLVFGNAHWVFQKLFLIPCEEIAIFLRRHHCLVFDISLSQIYKSRFVFFEIEVNENKVLSVFTGLRDCKFEHLLIPTFANPTHIFEFSGFIGCIIPGKDDVIAVDIFVNN